MSAQLYFVYDSHCPWSYASTSLVNAIAKAYPEFTINLWHCGHYDGTDSAGLQQAEAVVDQSTVKFGKAYISQANKPQDSTLSANLMAWMISKQPANALAVLNALQHAHFIEGNPLRDQQDFAAIIEQFKLSPPTKVFKDSISKDADHVLSEVAELQEHIGTTASAALFLLTEDKAVLLNHELYLEKPTAIVEAVQLELN